MSVSDGSASPPGLTYSTPSEGSWLLVRTATESGAVTLPWAWSGDHGRTKVRERLAVGLYRDGGFEEVAVLVDEGLRDLTGDPGFRYAGRTTLEVAAGDVYGFALRGSGGPGGSKGQRLTGSFTLPAPPVLTLPDSPVTATADDDAGARVDFEVAASDEIDGALPVTCTPESGTLFPVGDTTVTCTATSSSEQEASGELVVRVFRDQPHQVWPRAQLMGARDTATGTLRAPGQALWFRFPVQPDSVVDIDLTDLAADYDLTVFGDIAGAFDEVLTPGDLDRLGAEFAADAFSPSAFSPSAFSPSAFSPSAFSPSAFSPDAFSPSAFSPSAFSPSAFSPSAFSPSAFSPSAFSPSAFSPAVSLPSAFSPSAFSPSAFSEAELRDAFSSAQTRSLIAVSARDGIADEHVRVQTWSEQGHFYVRVRGRNGAHAPGEPFTLSTDVSGGPCGEPMSEHTDEATYRGEPGSARTVVLTDSSRLAGAPMAELRAFAARSEIGGVVVDAAGIPRVQALQAQADRLTACPHAKNLVAEELRRVVDSFRDGDETLRYVVIAGDDAVVPFFRTHDAAGLGPEQGYVPPVADDSSSQAALRRNQVLSQDGYGSSVELDLKGARVPVPDLAVGRLVESPQEIIGALERYAALDAGTLPTPESALVTGYDFLTDAADVVAADLEAGLGGDVHELVTDRHVPPSATTQGGTPTRDRSWTADDLRGALAHERHDILFLAGHFSANSALAADHSTSVVVTELTGDDVDLADSFVMSVGCHSGYNIVDAHALPFVTEKLDWAQLMARKGALMLAGTGYQYGDTDLLEYSERLYAGVTHQLRVGTGPVAVGEALLRAKQDYLATTPVLSGIHQKALLEATLFGLPMVALDLPGVRVPADTPGTSVPVPVADGPGAVLGLHARDVSTAPVTALQQQPFDQVRDGHDRFTYLRGPEGTTTSPGQPALPLQVQEVGAAGLSLRGVAFRGGTYTDLPGIVPLTGAPTTDASEVHTAFSSPVFFPRRLALPNTMGALAGDGGTRLLVTPAQHRSDSPLTSTLRRYDDLDLRLLYSGHVAEHDGNRPALAAPPSISGVSSQVVEGADGTTRVPVEVHVVGDPSAGIQEVWLTRTAERGPWYGAWRSLDLVQDAEDSTRWTGELVLPPGQDPQDVRFVVQAANGVGLVSVDDNQGRELTPGVDPAALPTTGTGATGLALEVDGPAVLGADLQVSARLTGPDGPVADRVVRFALGQGEVAARTDADGLARADLRVVEQPGEQSLSATFDGDAQLRPVVQRDSIVVAKRPTVLELAGPGGPVRAGTDTGVTLRLRAGGAPVADRAVLVVARDEQDEVVAATVRRTDPTGEAVLGAWDLPVGELRLVAFFGRTGVDVGEGRTAGSADPENAGATSPALLLSVLRGSPAQVVTSSLPDAVAGEPYEAGLVVEGDPTPDVSVSGLPAGLTSDGSTITGSTTAAGVVDVVVVAGNRWGEQRRVLSLRVLPGAPAALTTVSGDGQAAVHGTELEEPLVVRVEDAWGNPVPGVPVRFSSPETGPGTDPRAVVADSDQQGEASAVVVAGPDVGGYEVTAGAAGATTTLRLTNLYAVGPFGPPFDDESGTASVPASSTHLLRIPVADGHGRVGDLQAVQMAIGCRVQLLALDADGAPGQSRCAGYDVVAHEFVVPVSGPLSGWRAGGSYRLRVDVLSSAGATPELLGRREVEVLAR